MSWRQVAQFVTVALTLAGTAAAFAQTAAPPTPPVTAGWGDGFFIQSDNGDFRLQVGALVHLDGRFALDDVAESVNDTFVVRRLRPYLRGRIARRFEFFFNPDFGLGTLVLQDAYVDTIFSPAFRLRIGKAKSPFGFERLHVVGNMLFFERAMPTSIAPNRDVGIQILGETFRGRLSYLGGVVNGVPDGMSADIDTGDGKDVVGRVVVKPFATEPKSPLQQLMLGFSVSAGPQSGALALPTYRTVSLQQAYFSYSGATADGVRTRYSPQLAYFYKAFGGWVEYARSELPVRKAEVVEDVAHDAWQIAGSIDADRRTALGRHDGGSSARQFRFRSGPLRRAADRRALSRLDRRGSRLHRGSRRRRVEPQGERLDRRRELVPDTELPLRPQLRAHGLRRRR